MNTVGGLGGSDVLVLDIEVTDNVGPSGVASWSATFVKEVMALTGLPPSRVLGWAARSSFDLKRGVLFFFKKK